MAIFLVDSHVPIECSESTETKWMHFVNIVWHVVFMMLDLQSKSFKFEPCRTLHKHMTWV